MSAEGVVTSFVVNFAFGLVVAGSIDFDAEVAVWVVEVEDVGEEWVGVDEAEVHEVMGDGGFRFWCVLAEVGGLCVAWEDGDDFRFGEWFTVFDEDFDVSVAALGAGFEGFVAAWFRVDIHGFSFACGARLVCWKIAVPGTFGSLRKSRWKLQVLGGSVRLKKTRELCLFCCVCE